MKYLLIGLFFLLSSLAMAQSPTSDKKPKPATETPKQKKKAVNKTQQVKTGKADPTEQGSGMTVPAQDQPKLDVRPNPATTVPSSTIPVDGNPKP